MELYDRFAKTPHGWHNIDYMPPVPRAEYAKHNYRPRFRDIKAQVASTIANTPILYALGGLAFLISAGLMTNEEKHLKPVHPGDVLLNDFMLPINLSSHALARTIGVSPRCINEIIHGKRAISADMAIRLSRFLGTSAEVWMGLQASYELDSIIYTERTKQKNF